MDRYEHYVTPRYQSPALQHMRWKGEPHPLPKTIKRGLLWTGIFVLFLSTFF